MDPSTTLLFLLAVGFLHLGFVMIILQYGAQPRWALVYLIAVAFFSALYFRRRLWLRHQRGRVYNGLGYTAVMLGALASSLLFSGVVTGTALSLAVCVWLGLAIAAYFFYRVIVLHIDEAAAVQMPVAWRAPV